MTKIFLTGATGYIGGEALHCIATTTEHHISCLVRDSSKAKIVQQRYPDVRVVLGDLDDAELVQREAENADVVFHLAGTSHLVSSKAVAKGMSNASRAKPGYWIQMSGATMVCANEISSGSFGESPRHTYDDLDDLSDIVSLVTSNPKRTVDNLVITQDPSKIRTALIVGPLIYGQGQGPVHQRSIQAPEIARVTIARKHGFRLGAGKNVWSNIHIRDLGTLFAALLGAAEAGKDSLWNEAGIIVPENGAMSFGDLCSSIAQECHAQGLVESADQETITPAEADQLSSHASVLWGTNAVLKSSRARKYLSWTPSGPSLLEDLPETVRREAASLEA